MTLDDLQTRWMQHEAALHDSLRLNRGLLRTLTLDRARNSLRWSAAWAAAGLIPTALWLLWLGSFLFDHLADPRFSIPAAILHVYTIALAAATGKLIAAKLSVDFTQPVAAIQRQIAALRSAQMKITQFIVYTAALIWVPLAIVTLRAWLPIDPYANPRWILGNLLFGVCVIPVLHAAARSISARAQAEPGGFFQELLRDAGGYYLRRASQVVAELEEPNA